MKEKALTAENTSLKAKNDSFVMDNNLLAGKITRLENGKPFLLKEITTESPLVLLPEQEVL